jgi:hypothetical protein
MDRCSQISTMLILDIGDPIIETPTFSRMDLADPLLSDAYTEHPNPAGFSLLVGGQNGTEATLEDFQRMTRASLFAAYEDHGSLSGVFGPRCSKHVGLEEWRPFMVHTTPRTTNTDPVGVVFGSDLDFHDTLWDWLDVGSGVHVDITRIDVASGAALSSC